MPSHGEDEGEHRQPCPDTTHRRRQGTSDPRPGVKCPFIGTLLWGGSLAFSFLHDRQGIGGDADGIDIVGDIAKRDRLISLLVKPGHVFLEAFAGCVHPRVFAFGDTVKLDHRTS